MDKQTTVRTIRGRSYKLAGYMTFDEYWNSDACRTYDSNSILRRAGPDVGLKTRYSIWEPKS